MMTCLFQPSRSPPYRAEFLLFNIDNLLPGLCLINRETEAHIVVVGWHRYSSSLIRRRILQGVRHGLPFLGIACASPALRTGRASKFHMLLELTIITLCRR